MEQLVEKDLKEFKITIGHFNFLYKIGEIYPAEKVTEFTNFLHFGYWEDEDNNIEERVNINDKYILTYIPIDKIETPIFSVDEEKIEDYSLLDKNTTPPIVLFNLYGRLEIIDGAHRYFAYKKNNEKRILAFVGISSN